MSIVDLITYILAAIGLIAFIAVVTKPLRVIYINRVIAKMTQSERCDWYIVWCERQVMRLHVFRNLYLTWNLSHSTFLLNARTKELMELYESFLLIKKTLAETGTLSGYPPFVSNAESTTSH